MKNLSIFLLVTGLTLGGCCHDDFIIPGGDYDFFEGALDVTNLYTSSDCSADAAYTTEGATPDGEASNCDGPNNNRWFKFTASNSGYLSMSVQVGGISGTQTETVITLWHSNGNEIYCETYDSPNDSVYLSVGDLTPGAVYYLSVDCTSDTVGTFTLCLSDTD
jgi:hypothetical protein